jgi:hypothetical protein
MREVRHGVDQRLVEALASGDRKGSQICAMLAALRRNTHRTAEERS